MQRNVAIIGGGPAGLTAAYLLAKANIPVVVMEADPHYLGGIARTATYKNYCFDIGGHRFFSKSKEIEELWSEILPQDMLMRPRLSRIFYQQKFYSYPLKLHEVLINLGLLESFFCFLSYLKSLLFPIKNPTSFADWVSNKFGKRLFNIFFKTYTEKVWGMPCDEISADWAAQRIKGLSFFSAVINAIFAKKTNTVKTLINAFRYPRKGPGMLWSECANKIKQLGGHVLQDARVTQCQFTGESWKITYQKTNGQLEQIDAFHLISSAPLHELIVNYLQPQLSAQSIAAATSLKYRDFLIVVLIVKGNPSFSDNWIYIHDPAVKVARIQNFKSWSEEMVPDPAMSCYGMEYFCFAGDGIWTMADKDLIEKAKDEIAKIGLIKANEVVDGCVVRQLKAYPVYDEHYKKNVAIIREEIADKFPTLHLVGRNGMHKYNNQDHAMMTAILTVKNILLGKKVYNVWQVNQDAEYHEEGTLSDDELGLRAVPSKISL